MAKGGFGALNARGLCEERVRGWALSEALLGSSWQLPQLEAAGGIDLTKKPPKRVVAWLHH